MILCFIFYRSVLQVRYENRERSNVGDKEKTETERHRFRDKGGRDVSVGAGAGVVCGGAGSAA